VHAVTISAMLLCVLSHVGRPSLLMVCFLHCCCHCLTHMHNCRSCHLQYT